jgi:aspartyl-tRNA(Asn)/glutamyl-tRNA(Gln) amidotransferase subunit B
MTATSRWIPTIGLEVHVQLATRSKLFSRSAVEFGADPNSLTDEVVLALPGALPRFNQAVVDLALRLALATHSQVRLRSRFARKHYFYPDLPKGYQISQYDEPICEHGQLDVLVGNQVRVIRLTRIHLEEDAGKNTHHGRESWVDLNRAGIPLLEVVSAPELPSAEEAAEFLRSLHRLVRWLGVSEADMEKGQLRCDANVSVRPSPDAPLGTRTELKNINSFRFVQRAIEHEIARQIRILDDGGHIEQQTRLWNADADASFPMRSKEDANDYRYLPDPDLPPLVISEAELHAARAALPELPLEIYQRLCSSGVSADDARMVIGDRALWAYIQDTAAALEESTTARGVRGPGSSAASPPGSSAEPALRQVVSWVVGEVMGALNRDGLDIAACPVSPPALASLLALVSDQTISGKIAKEVFALAYRTGQNPGDIVDEQGLRQITDSDELSTLVATVIAANPRQAEQYRGGKTTLLSFFVGQVMKASGGRANPKTTTELVQALLAADSGAPPRS